MAVIKSASHLKKLQKQLGSDQAIGDRFGISRQAIHQHRNRFKIPAVPDLHKERNKEIVAMRKKGNPATSIAKAVDLAVCQVYRILNKN